jgi:hypothetical protein
MPEMKRINCDSVTEALIRAMEYADKMKHVVILYESKEEEDHPGGFFTQDDVTLANINFLLDKVKFWIFGP